MPEQREHWGAIERAVGAVASSWRNVTSDGAEAELRSLERDVRYLAERGRQAGHRRVADFAGIVEVMLGPVVAGEEAITPEFRGIVTEYVAGLVELAELPPDDSADTAATATRRVLMLTRYPPSIEGIAPQLEHFGYTMEVVMRFDGLLSRLRRNGADAVLLDLDGLSAASFSELSLRAIDQAAGQAVPKMMISRSGDLTHRLTAARAQASAYLLKPLDPHDLVDELDAAMGSSDAASHRIMLVEDSPTQAAYYKEILEDAGISVVVVHDSMRVLEVLDDHGADLLLMDMYMPVCSGTELARVIRQFPAYASLPIVFLSDETEVARQLDAMSLGGDDFLTKPIDPLHLVRSVTIRAQRARALRTLMVTDNLTGLLNHTHIKEQLKQELGKAARRRSRVAFAMLDIDHFKTINDTYGHPVGDRVIKTLSRVLQQRLRETDYIGRYGGEEFAVILPEATGAEACAILDAVRHSFSRIRHMAGDGGFQVTFSGGVAAFPAIADAEELARQADVALYAAKQDGRDRIYAAKRELMPKRT